MKQKWYRAKILERALNEEEQVELDNRYEMAKKGNIANLVTETKEGKSLLRHIWEVING